MCASNYYFWLGADAEKVRGDVRYWTPWGVFAIDKHAR